MSRPISRRDFLQHGLIGATAAAPLFISRSALAQGDRPGANSRVGVALIGCGRRGQSYVEPGLPPRWVARPEALRRAWYSDAHALR